MRKEEIVVSLDMVLNKLTKINPNKSPGPDLLHPRVIYEVKEVIAYHLTLTAALDQLRVVASSTSNDPGPRSRQHQQIG